MANNFVTQTQSQPFQCIQNVLNPIVSPSPAIIPETFSTPDTGMFSTYVSLIPKGATAIYSISPHCHGTSIDTKDNFIITPTNNVEHALYAYANLSIDYSGLLFNGSTDEADVYYLFSYVNSHNLQGQLTLLEPLVKP